MASGGIPQRDDRAGGLRSTAGGAFDTVATAVDASLIAAGLFLVNAVLKLTKS